MHFYCLCIITYCYDQEKELFLGTIKDLEHVNILLHAACEQNVGGSTSNVYSYGYYN